MRKKIRIRPNGRSGHPADDVSYAPIGMVAAFIRKQINTGWSDKLNKAIAEAEAALGQ